jgi:hypothetical protein
VSNPSVNELWTGRQIAGFDAFALIAKKPCHAPRRAQLPGFCPLSTAFASSRCGNADACLPISTATRTFPIFLDRAALLAYK